MTDFDLDDQQSSSETQSLDRPQFDRIYRSALYRMEEATGEVARWVRRAADERASRRATICGVVMAGLGAAGAFVSAVVPGVALSPAVAVALVVAGAALIATAVISEALLRMRLLGSAHEARELTTDALQQMRKARENF